MDDGLKFSDLPPAEQKRIADKLRKQNASEPSTGDAPPVVPAGFVPDRREKAFGYGERHPHKLN